MRIIILNIAILNDIIINPFKHACGKCKSERYEEMYEQINLRELGIILKDVIENIAYSDNHAWYLEVEDIQLYPPSEIIKLIKDLKKLNKIIGEDFKYSIEQFIDLNECGEIIIDKNEDVAVIFYGDFAKFFYSKKEIMQMDFYKNMEKEEQKYYFL